MYYYLNKNKSNHIFDNMYTQRVDKLITNIYYQRVDNKITKQFKQIHGVFNNNDYITDKITDVQGLERA